MKKATKGALAMVVAGAVTFSISSALLVDPIPKKIIEENTLIRSGDQEKTAVNKQAEKPVAERTYINKMKAGANVLSEDKSLEKTSKANVAAPAVKRNTETFSKNNNTIIRTSEKINKTSSKTTLAASGTKARTTVTVSSATGTRPTNTASAPASKLMPATSTKAPTTTASSKPTGTNKTSTAAAPTSKPAPSASTKAPVTTTASKPTSAKTTNTKPTLAAKKAAAAPKGNADKSTTPAAANRGQQVSQAAKEKAANKPDKEENNGKKM
ncbi:hypothetical protein [Peribacillus sp. SCS-155]|uniref:hypothetical protein n=1 Tax=Peribacillus sedimenti TaxID=3115297 RepID=UPI0039062CA2